MPGCLLLAKINRSTFPKTGLCHLERKAGSRKVSAYLRKKINQWGELKNLAPKEI